MVTGHIAYQTFDWFYDKKIVAEFINLIGHKDNKSVYGGLFIDIIENKLYFVQHKWEVQKGNQVPRIYAKEVIKVKEVDDTIWNSFEKISIKEHSDRWSTELMKI